MEKLGGLFFRNYMLHRITFPAIAETQSLKITYITRGSLLTTKEPSGALLSLLQARMFNSHAAIDHSNYMRVAWC